LNVWKKRPSKNKAAGTVADPKYCPQKKNRRHKKKKKGYSWDLPWGQTKEMK